MDHGVPGNATIVLFCNNNDYVCYGHGVRLVEVRDKKTTLLNHMADYYHLIGLTIIIFFPSQYSIINICYFILPVLGLTYNKDVQ